MNVWEKYKIQVNDWDSLLRIKFEENCSDGNFCDVGAGHGAVTLVFKKLAVEGKVYTFEINPLNYKHILKYADNNCIIENIAIGYDQSEVDVYADGEYFPNYTSTTLANDPMNRSLKSIHKVKSISLDDYFREKKLDYLKIDTEGTELDVLKGALKTIKNCKYVVIECHYEKDWSEIYDFLKSNDLDFRNLTTDEPIFIGECEVEPGLMSNGMPHQIYLKNI